MNPLRQGTCDQPNCNRTGLVIAKVLSSSGAWCYTCNNKRLAQEKLDRGIKPKQYTFKPKATGQKEVFEKIWKTRKHVSFISNKKLGDDAYSWFFAHVLSKAQNQYPEFMLNPDNIVLLTQEEHDIWDKHPRSEIIDNPLWKPMFELEARLKEEYSSIHSDK